MGMTLRIESEVGSITVTTSGVQLAEIFIVYVYNRVT